MSNTVKKVLIIVLEVILLLSLGCFAIGCTAKEMVVNVIANEALDDTVAYRVMDIVFEEFPDANINQLGNVQEAITKNPAIKEITSKYIDEMCRAIAENEVFDSPDIDVEIMQLVDENMEAIENNIGVQISQSQRNEIYEKLNEQKTEIEGTLQQVTYNMVSSSYQSNIRSVLIKVFLIIDTLYFKLSCIILAVLSILGLFYLKKSTVKTLLQLSITVIVVGFSLAFIFPTIFERLGMNLTNKFLGRTLIVDFSLFKKFGYVYCIVGIILCLLYLILKKKFTGADASHTISKDEESNINSFS